MVIQRIFGRHSDPIQKVDQHKFAHVKNQFLAVICVNLATLSHGMAIGWLSPAMLHMMSENSPMDGGPVDLDLIGWIGAISNVGGVLGNFFFSWVTARFGRRIAMILLAVPNIIFWISIFVIRDPVYLLPARVICGLTGGGVFICVPLFVAEVASNHVRGTLGAILTLSINTGILISYLTGAYLEYHVVPCVHIVFPVLFLLGTIMLPETPQYFIKINKIEEAERSLRFYKGCSTDTTENRERFEKELETLRSIAKIKDTEGDTKLEFNDFWNPTARRGILITIAILSINIFSGNLLMLNYAASIFKDSGSTLDANTSSIIMITVQIIGTYTATFFVDRLGRRLLMIVSTFGTGAALATMGTFTYLNEQGVDLSSFDWVPVLSLSMSVFMSAMGIFPLVFILIGEVLPLKIREIASTYCLALISMFLLIVVKVFPTVVSAFGLYTGFWFFAFVCVLGLLFSIFVLPETMGKNIN